MISGRLDRRGNEAQRSGNHASLRGKQPRPGVCRPRQNPLVETQVPDRLGDEHVGTHRQVDLRGPPPDERDAVVDTVAPNDPPRHLDDRAALDRVHVLRPRRKSKERQQPGPRPDVENDVPRLDHLGDRPVVPGRSNLVDQHRLVEVEQVGGGVVVHSLESLRGRLASPAAAPESDRPSDAATTSCRRADRRRHRAREGCSPCR